MSAAWAAGRSIGGKYTLIRRVGVGGMSEVWAAKNEMTGAHVALKLLEHAATRTDEVVDRFRHEAMVGAQLDHRNIARVYDLLEEPNGDWALVMTLLRGKPLSSHLQECKQLPEREAIAVGMSVLAALEHAHQCDVLHRDIKPGNIFLSVDPDGLVTPKLLDFGIAKLPTGGVQTRDGTFLGTPQYMAPERARDAGPIDARSDLFSVGVLLYEMLTGTSPFERSSAHGSLLAVVEQELDPDPLIPPMLWQVIRRLVAKSAGDRPASASEVTAMLRSATTETDLTMRWGRQELQGFTIAGTTTVSRRTPSEPEVTAAAPTFVDAPLEAALPRTASRTRAIAAALGSALFVGIVFALWKAFATEPTATAARAERWGRADAPFAATPVVYTLEAAPAPSGSQTAGATKRPLRPVGGKPDF